MSPLSECAPAECSNVVEPLPHVLRRQRWLTRESSLFFTLRQLLECYAMAHC